MFLTAQAAGAQSRLEGTWTAHFLTPGGEIASTIYQVTQAGDQLFAAMEFGGQRFNFIDYKLEGGTLSFTMDTGFVMDCRLERQATRQYKGSCLDEMGNVGPAVIGPPGVTVEPTDLDLDEAFDVWGLSKEEYERERAAEREREAERSRQSARAIQVPDPFPGRMIDLGGRRLNVVDVGKGDVTVVLEAGVGDDHKVWTQVQEDVAKRTRVLAYDRAGLGMSDPSRTPRTPDGIARELHSLLAASGARPPYVLVGHEAGTFAIRQFQSLYPDEVAGLVLVDPSHEDEDEMWARLDRRSREEYVARKRGLLTMISETAAGEFDAYLEAIGGGFALGIVDRPDVPLIVVSGLRPSEKPRWVGETPEGMRAKEKLHRSLAHDLGGEFVPVAWSGSNVHLEDPEKVVEAIARILEGIGE